MNGHLSREALGALLRGAANGAETARAVRHLVECRRCRMAAAGCLPLERMAERPPLRPEEARKALVTLLEAEVAGSLDVLKARSWWAEVRDLSPAEQVKRIRSTTALQSLPVFEAILADAAA